MKEFISTLWAIMTHEMLPLPFRISGAVMHIMMGYGVIQVRKFPGLSVFGKFIGIFKIIIFYSALLCTIALLFLSIFYLLKLSYVLWVM